MLSFTLPSERLHRKRKISSSTTSGTKPKLTLSKGGVSVGVVQDDGLECPFFKVDKVLPGMPLRSGTIMVRQNDPLHIKVTTASYFDWRGGNGLVAMVLLDGRTALQSSILKKSADGQQMEWTIDTWNLWRGQAEGWKRTQFKFMEITKDDVHSRRFEEQETFDVRVCRVLIDEHSRTPWNKAPLFFQKMRNTTFGFSEVEYKIVAILGDAIPGEEAHSESIKTVEPEEWAHFKFVYRSTECQLGPRTLIHPFPLTMGPDGYGIFPDWHTQGSSKGSGSDTSKPPSPNSVASWVCAMGKSPQKTLNSPSRSNSKPPSRWDQKEPRGKKRQFHEVSKDISEVKMEGSRGDGSLMASRSHRSGSSRSDDNTDGVKGINVKSPSQQRSPRRTKTENERPSSQRADSPRKPRAYSPLRPQSWESDTTSTPSFQQCPEKSLERTSSSTESSTYQNSPQTPQILPPATDKTPPEQADEVTPTIRTEDNPTNLGPEIDVSTVLINWVPLPVDWC